MYPPLLTLAILLLAIPLRAPGAELKGARLFKSGPIQITADGRFVWTVNPDHDSVSRLDTASDALVEFSLPAGEKQNPKGLSLKEDGSEIWVACHDSDRVYVLNHEGQVLERIDLPWGAGPYSIALSPDQEKAVVTLHRAEAVAVIDVPARTLAKVLRHLFWAPMGAAWTDEGAAVWINHIFAPGEHPLQTRIDFSGAEPAVSAAIRITPADPRQSGNLAAPYKLAEGGYLNVRGHSAQIPSGSGRNELWLPTQYHNFNTDAFTPDSTMQSAVRRINLSTRKLLELNQDKVILSAVQIHAPANGGAYQGPGWNAQVAGPVDIGFSLDGSMVCLLHELSNDLVLMPTSTPPVKPAGSPALPEISVGARPIGLAMSPAAPIAYVYNFLSRDISKIDLATRIEIKRIPATPLTGEPFSAKLLRGARIFHTSDDPRISVNSKIACASCHINGEHDGRNWSFDRLPGAHGPRHVSSLLGLRLSMGPSWPQTGWGQLHRSGDRDEIQDFEHTFQGVQMGGTGFLGAAAQPELGEPNAGRSEDLDALAAYLLFLDPLPRSPFRGPGGILSEEAIRGATFFLGSNRAVRRGDAGCAACHVPETGFLDFGYHDVGQRRDPNEKELNSRTPQWRVNTPTLVGVWATPPYSGLAEFGEAHSAEGAMLGLLQDSAKRANNSNHHGKPNGLTSRQLRDLAAFVLSIDGNMTASEIRTLRDTTPPRIVRTEPASLTRIDVWFNEAIKKSGAEDLQNWAIEDARGNPIAITRALLDPQNGDRVQLQTQLQPHQSYVLQAKSGILDDADAASGGTANPLDPSAPENRRQLRIEDRLTITLGASGYENVTISVHDTAMVGPNLSTWSHDSVWLAPTPSGNPRGTTGFIRFAWQNAFKQVTGVNSSAAILKAGFSVHPEFGNTQPIEIRRALQAWSDPASGGDWNSSATGAPTWRDSAHPNKRWNLAGAGRLGSNGSTLVDYQGSNDLAGRADDTLEIRSLTGPPLFGGPLVTEAFRFWFENPSVDFGYALRLLPGATQNFKLSRSEGGLKDHGPVLTLTYLLPNAVPRLKATRPSQNVRLEWPVEYSGWTLQKSPGSLSQWEAIPAQPSADSTHVWIDLPTESQPIFFRLVN